MDLVAVYAGLSRNASAVSGLNCVPYCPDSIAEPQFYCGEMEIDYLQDFGTDDAVTIACRVLVNRTDPQAAQANLARYLRRTGSTSVKAAIEAAPTLGGACDDLIVKRVHGHRLYTVGEKIYLGAEFTVFVIGPES